MTSQDSDNNDLVKHKKSSISRTIMLTLVASAIIAFASLISVNVYVSRSNILEAAEASADKQTQLLAGQFAGAARWKKDKPINDSLDSFYSLEGGQALIGKRPE